MAYISQRGLQNLHSYKYKGVDLSPITKYILQPYWEWALRFVPLWVAPNMITLTGFLCTIATYLLMQYYCPQLEGRAPSWVYFACGIGLFFYQTLDNLDGKQARRTRTSSPLGQLFDHGCDALCCPINVCTIASAANLGSSWATVVIFLAIFTPFYVATWEEHHTGVLFLGVISGPIEGLLVMVAIYLLTGFAGPELWMTSLKDAIGLEGVWGSYSLAESLVIVQIIVAVGLCAYSIKTVVTHLRAQGRSVTEAFAMFIPYSFLVILTITWILCSPTRIFTHRPRTYICTVGFLFANQVARLILAHLTDQPFEPGNLILFPLGAGALHAFVSSRVLSGVPLISEDLLLDAALVTSVIAWAHLAYNVINEITAYLNISCLTIPYPPPPVTSPS
mmetsp:Transcript_24532/g.40359  ORF Transcript_24532/g.40359 Transcript_24532/m.40359 type:complete len:392 (+) Transcript_24532:177-1352(+)